MLRFGVVIAGQLACSASKVPLEVANRRRRGDAGETDLFGSGRVSKDTLRVEVYGAVDELNAFAGVAAAAAIRAGRSSSGSRFTSSAVTSR